MPTVGSSRGICLTRDPWGFGRLTALPSWVWALGGRTGSSGTSSGTPEGSSALFYQRKGLTCISQSHGRDNKLLVWQLGITDEKDLDKTPPVDAASVARKQPWLLYALTVNALNFCSFAMCRDGMPPISAQKTIKDNRIPDPILIAVPNTIDSGGIDIYHLPSQTRAAQIHSERSVTTGMVMALSILADSHLVQVAASYESGHTMVFVQNDPAASFQKLYSARSHKQPILSMSISPSKDHYVTSAADAVIAMHPLPAGQSIWNTELKPLKVVQTGHYGQQGLKYRSDGRVFATAGWDSSIRVYSSKTMKELAVLKWHKVGCYATSFANINPPAVHQQPVLSKENENSITPSEENSALSTIQQRRDDKARSTHWLAAGAKDGKVSLWDIY